ncbi:MAG TPA: polysaccharide biosynthesis/export family protein [Longimicrobiaceae bacterium]|nr:polysaccharide biosynthesis/export family protein [Longimicrobiaceae bacterium]
MILPLVLLALGLAMVPAGAAAQDGAVDTPPAMLRPGDRAAIQVWRNAELSGTLTVGEDSTLVHPIYGAVKVAGVPIPTAQERVQQFLTGFTAEPRITFVPEFRVYVGGAVRDPNQHHFPQMSVGAAITRAGGSTAPNRTHRVRLIRDGREWVANLNGDGIAAILQEPIRSGDQIIVEERTTFTRSYVGPALQVLQTITSLLTTYLFIDQVFGSDAKNFEAM